MIVLVLVIILFILTLYIYCVQKFKYWQERGVKHDTPIPIFGNNISNYLMKKSVVQVATEVYCKYPREKIVGFYRGFGPELVVRDPDIIKRILITDFVHFSARGFNYNKDVIELLMRNLFFADGDMWKLLRQRLTPTFTSGKLKAMFPLITERAEKLQDRALAAAQSEEPIDVRELMARYTTDFIGACGFGLNADSLNDENSVFRKLGAKIFNLSAWEVVLSILKEMCPNLFKNLKTMAKIEGDMIDIVHQILKQRNYEPSGRNDFIDLLLECKQKGKIFGDSIEKRKADGAPEQVELDFDNMLIVSQVFVFFAAGFETSSSATSFTLHQLAFNPKEQEKIQEEIDNVLDKHGGLTYDAIKDMTYLDCAFKESLRLFPSLGYLMRECVHDYTIPEVGVRLTPGVRVIIPTQAIQNDETYFEEPNRFNPERFLQENMKSKNKFVYLPFGDGPRACIGARLGIMQSKAGLAALLSRFKVKPCEKTLRKLPVDPKSSVVQTVLGGIPLVFHKRTKVFSTI